MKRQQKFNILISVLLVLNMVIILALLVWSYFVLTQLKENGDQKKYRTELLQTKAQNLAELDANYSKVEADLALTEIALPSRKDVSKLISDVDVLAKQSSLAITSVRFAAEKGKTTTDPSLLQTIKGKNGYELPVDLTVEGSYGDFTAFIGKLENYLRINNIASFELGLTGNKDKPNEVSSTLKVTFYLVK